MSPREQHVLELLLFGASTTKLLVERSREHTRWWQWNTRLTMYNAHVTLESLVAKDLVQLRGDVFPPTYGKRERP